MRYMTSAPGIALASWFRLPRDSVYRYVIVVSSSFFWSGIVHMGVIPPEPLNTSYSALRLRIQLASFFWLQVIGVAMELVFQNSLRLDRGTRINKLGDISKSTKNRPKVHVDFPRSFVSRTVWKLGVFSWTAGFLAVTAWWTIYPVAREVNWWGLKSVPSLLRLP
jgi:hypothetical protein